MKRSCRSCHPRSALAGQQRQFGRFGAHLRGLQAGFDGDAEAAQFTWWAENIPALLTDVDVYKASHHGSENGDTPLSMSRFKPETVVVSAGLDNRYNHPTPRALRLYDAVGANVFRTDVQGTVVVTANRDGTYQVEVDRALPTQQVQSEPVLPSATDRDSSPPNLPYNPSGTGSKLSRFCLTSRGASLFLRRQDRATRTDWTAMTTGWPASRCLSHAPRFLV